MGASIGILDSDAESDYQVSVYGDLSSITDQIVGDIAIVETTSGGIFGIGSKEAGAYRWNGTTWEYFSQSLKDEIKANEDAIALLIASSVQSVTGTGVDNTDPLNPIVDAGAVINNSKLYKAFSNAHPNINGSIPYQTLFYKPATAGTFDNAVFTPVANGVQLLKDLVNVTTVASAFVVDNIGQRTSLAVSIAINGVVSTIEDVSYIRRANGTNEDLNQVIETFPELSAGDVITVLGKRNGNSSVNANGIEDKGMLSVLGFEPTNAAALTGFPPPVITSITTT